MKDFCHIIILLFFFLLASCGGIDRPLVIGLVPSTSPEDLKREFEPVRRYLEREMRTALSLSVPDDYRSLIAAMGNGDVDIALFGPFSYIVAESRQELLPLVVRKKREKGVSNRSIIVASKDSGIGSIEELRGRRFAFVNTASTSGFLMPSALFRSRNIGIDSYFSGYTFEGSHDRVLEQVQGGEADAGAISKSIFESLAAANRVDLDDIRILWESDPVPASPFVARADLNRRLRSRFVNAMLAIHEKDPAALEALGGSIERFVPVEPGMYNVIRNIVNILGEEYIIRNYSGDQ